MSARVLQGWAAHTADELLADLRTRRDHVRQVAALAVEVSRAIGSDGSELIAAAWLHDIGYAGGLAKTGFHPLDGARFLRDEGHEGLALLVAHHSGARNEASLRGIDDYLDEFPFADSQLHQALTYCDLTTGPDGRRVTLESRIAEIQRRYGHDHVVAQAIRIGTPEFKIARDQTELRMAQAGIVVSGSLAYPPAGSQ
jgi:hypothetical protein